MPERRNFNRGYQQLRVWQDAQELYVRTCEVYRPFPYDLKRVASQNIASVDSVHRNIAEGYCRRSLNEYIQHLYIALGSLRLVASLEKKRTDGDWTDRIPYVPDKHQDE
jgi:hypothetical protein